MAGHLLQYTSVTQRGPPMRFAGRPLLHLARTQATLPESLMRLRGIFLGSDSFVFTNRVTKRKPGMANGHNRGCSSQREFGFRSQGLALVEVCLALFERDHGLPPEVLEPIRR